ncbi:GIY-YIG nuclease family protein [Candidatus Daviesbacteria bacterium]|nr:GIY-YIG nuclease family protein [Candidatus Daviesbacteria bacterium]
MNSSSSKFKGWKWYVYIVECLDGFYYTGTTWNVEKRMEQHKSGKGSRFTSKHGFKRLCYVEEFNSLDQARQREIQLKDFSRQKKEALWI